MSNTAKLYIIVILFLAALFIDLPKLNGVYKVFPQIDFKNIHLEGRQIDLAKITDRFPLKLGLDLQGGSQLVMETQMDKIDPADRDNALASAREVIERRVNLFGVSESLVQTSKVGESRRILVELPGVSNTQEAVNLVGKTAQLEFREMDASASATASGQLISLQNTKGTGLTGADLKKAQVTFSGGNSTKSGPQISLEFTAEGARKFAEITKRNIGKQLAIFLDEQPIQAPTVQQEIVGGNAVITGSYTAKEAQQVVAQLNAGALPVPIKLIEQRTVGAALGQESIKASIFAGIVGFTIIALFMVSYYGVYGLIADIALIIYSVFVLAIFKTGLFVIPPITLTLAGIAGFVLSIGMAVDANILIFERIKEERRWGKSKTVALDQGFRRAWSSIRDSNISSLMTAAILYALGTGLVRGFAVTLAIGVLVSMFTAVTVTRTLLKLIIK